MAQSMNGFDQATSRFQPVELDRLVHAHAHGQIRDELLATQAALADEIVVAPRHQLAVAGQGNCPGPVAEREAQPRLLDFRIVYRPGVLVRSGQISPPRISRSHEGRSGSAPCRSGRASSFTMGITIADAGPAAAADYRRRGPSAQMTGASMRPAVSAIGNAIGSAIA